MKKSLLAFTLLSLATGIAFAQSSVTIYGVVDAGITNENNGGAAGAVTRLDSGLRNGSRLGFKGTEDLGGGLSAIFTIENGFSIDTGVASSGGLLFGRQAWVGIAGPFGTVKLGRQKTASYANVETLDPFANSLAGDAFRMFNAAGSRTDNTISYGFAANGFRGELEYGFGEVAGSTAARRKVGGFAGYANGPVDVVATHTNFNDATGSDSAKTTIVGGNYNFGPVKTFAAYGLNKGVGTLDTRDAMIGLTAPVGGAGLVMASYIRKTDKSKANGDSTQFGVGYLHNLSKRTALYMSYARLTNQSEANAGNFAAANGATDRLFDVGIRHNF